MKKRIISLSILTVLAGLAVNAAPAFAGEGRGARFDFEPNTWGPKQFEKRHYQNFSPPMTSVGHGMVPKASSIFGSGVDPNFLKPVPKPQPVVATSVRPSASWGQPTAQIQPKPAAPTPFNPAFGTAPQNVPVVAQQPPQMAPQMAAPSSNKSLSGRMMPPRRSNSHAKSAVAGRMLRPKQPTAMVAQPKIANYGGNFFQQGSTKPTSSGSGYSTSADAYGKILKHD